MPPSEPIDHETAKIFLDEFGHVRFQFKENADISLKHARDYVDIIDSLCAGQKRSFILDARSRNVHVTTENRKFMGQNPDALKWRKADVILVNSESVKILANLYMRFDTPGHPVKVFTDERSALAWLAQLS